MYLEGLVVQTKLSSLRPLKRTIDRPRLTHRILEAVDYRLTLLQAGAGYGKTTALAMLADKEYPLVWYHLDPEDCDPLIFLLYLIHGFRRALPSLSEAPLAMLESWKGTSGALPAMAIVDTLINELAEEISRPTLLILDDVHLLNPAPETLHILERLIKHGPANLHLILSTRYPLRLGNLVTMRVRGEMLEIGEDEFAFTPDEIQNLFRSYHAAPLSPREIDLLARETEGWAIALQLVRQGLTAETPPSLPEELSQLSGLKDDLFTYLAQEILDQQPEDLREFLLTTSVLRQMTASVCNNIRDANDSTQILSRLLEAGLFVAEMDELTVRYHHLFREFLYHKLPPERRQASHLKAAACYQDGGEYEEAINHYLLAGAVERAAILIHEYGRTMVLEGRLETLAGWISELPPATIEGYPDLLIFQGDIARLRSRFDEALRWYEHAEMICRAQGDSQGITGALRGRARVYLDTVNPSQAEPLLREALRLSDGQEDRETRARLFDLLAENQLNRGRPEEAKRLQDEARKLREEGPGEADLDARVLLRTGRLDEARHMLAERAEVERHDPVQRPRAHRETLLLLSFILACQGKSEEAYQSAVEGTQRGEVLNSPFITAVGHMRQGHAWLIRNDGPDRYTQAERCFERAIEISDELSVARLKVEAYWGLCRSYGYRGELAHAEEAARLGIEIAESAGDEWIIAMIRVSVGGTQILAGQYEEALASLGLASIGFARCADTYGETAVRLWQCLAWYEMGDELRLRHGLDALLESVHAHGYEYLLTHHTLPGPPDPRRLVPLLIFARTYCERLSVAADLLRQLGLERVEHHPGYQLRVQMLGAFRVWRGSEELAAGDWQRDRARQLFQLLLTWRGTMLDKERIWDLLWPDLDPDSANRSFKVALNAVFNALEPNREPGVASAYVARDGSLYGLRAGADMWIDSAQFERCVALGNAEYHHAPAQSIEHYRHALVLYQGDYLQEFAYEDWAGEKRRQLREFYLQAADRLAGTLIAFEQWDEAIEVCQSILAREACWEHAYRLMMIGYTRLGNRPQALKTYQRAVDTLRRDLDTDPSPETVDLYKSIAAS